MRRTKSLGCLLPTLTMLKWKHALARGEHARRFQRKLRVLVGVCLIGAAWLVLTPGLTLAAAGDLLWQNRGQAEFFPFGVAFAVAAQGNVVVATGNVCTTIFTGGQTCDWFIRAHDAKSGVTLWEDRLDPSGAFDRAQHIAVDAGRVFATGWVQTPAQGFDFVVRAYDLTHGTLLSETRIHRGGRNEFAEVVGAHGGRVFAAGRVLGATGSSDFTLIALDANTGAILWESVTDPGALREVDIAFAVSTKGDRVFVSGGIENISSLLIRAHDAATGSILWERQVANADNQVAPESLAVHGPLVFAAGERLNATGDFDFMVQAYDAETGTPVWTDQPASVRTDGAAVSLRVDGGRLFAAGYDECDPSSFFGCKFVVRAYDTRTGTLLWQDRFEPDGGDAFASTLAAKAGQVFVGGAALNAAGHYEWTVRAYDTTTGRLLWQDGLDGGNFSQVFGLTSAGQRLFAAGSVGSASRFDFTVRAYETR